MQSTPSLVRVLGVSDLTWLYLVAVVNLNMIPVVAAEGFHAMWLWTAVALLFFLPQGIAVIELADRMPGEGGLYLWTKETFGDFHGFLCGWCYWITNMFFVPALLFYVTGVTAYVGSSAALNNSRVFFFILTTSLLWLTILANIHGLAVGKWVNNAGGAGALTIAIVLMALAGFSANHGKPLQWENFALGNFKTLPLPTIGVMCLALVGLELGPVMGDEIRDSRRTIPRGVIIGGILCVTIYLGSTLSLLVAVPKQEMAVVQGMMQAIDRMSSALGLGWIVLPLAILMAASIVGSTSAWVSGSARILFVCGLDRYLPSSLGKIHSRYGSPHVALSMFGLLASAIVALSFIGASVKEAYLTLLDLSIALQMISYLYLFLTMARRAFSGEPASRYFPTVVLRLSSLIGLAMAAFGFLMAFAPTRQIESVWAFELKMLFTLALFLGLAGSLFFYYSRLRPHTVPVKV
ncbi:MAG: APC family permease [Bryobacteraceae bacterium]